MAAHAVQSSRNLRGFIRWMRDNNVEYSNALTFHIGDTVADIGVKALYDLHEGDIIATIPKQACLTILTSEAHEMIEEAELGGGLGLAVALMYEQSRGEFSKWYGYFQLIPFQQSLPFIWSLSEIDRLLVGTELHKVIKEDIQLMKQDWRECYGILCDLYGEEKFPIKWFSFNHYLAAKTLVASRAFEVDDVHGYGMVPLADLFNHKTAAEDVHFTSVLSDSDLGFDSDLGPDLEKETGIGKMSTQGRLVPKKQKKEEAKAQQKLKEDDSRDTEQGKMSQQGRPIEVPKKQKKEEAEPQQKFTEQDSTDTKWGKMTTRGRPVEVPKSPKEEEAKPKQKLKGDDSTYTERGKISTRGRLIGVPKKQKMEEAKPQQELKEDESLDDWEGSSDVLEMILVKDVIEGSEIYNTYGYLSNAALLHRYGFTEPDNPFDIVNVDLVTVIDICCRSYTRRHVRRCVAFWRKAGCAPCASQGSEYFEIAAAGKPQAELLMLLYIINLSDATRDKLEQGTAVFSTGAESPSSQSDGAESQAVERLALALGWKSGFQVKSGSRKRGRDTPPRVSTPVLAKITQNSNIEGIRQCRTTAAFRIKDPSWLTNLDKWLLSKPVCEILLALLVERDSMYVDVNSMTGDSVVGNVSSSSLENDRALLLSIDSKVDAKLYHALSLRVSERTILEKCSAFVSIKLKTSR